MYFLRVGLATAPNLSSPICTRALILAGVFRGAIDLRSLRGRAWYLHSFLCHGCEGCVSLSNL
eukprot:7372400-Lingulodinium_polyedra.AAC.1